MQPDRGLQPGRPLRSQLTAHRSWLPAGALLAVHLAFTSFGDRDLLAAVVMGLAAVVLYSICAAVHAFAHIVAAWVTQAPAVRARLFVFGDVQSRPSAASGRREIAIALAGPVASAVLGAGLLFASGAIENWPSDILRATAWTSLGLAGLNLIPGFPLDGGRLLAQLTGRDRTAVVVGRIAGLGAVVVGAWLLVGALAVVDDAAFGLWLALVGLFVLVEAKPAADAIPAPEIDVSGRTVGEWARPFAGRLHPGDPVPGDGSPYAVADGPRLAGVVTGSAARRGARSEDVMVPWSAELGIRTDAPLEHALERLAKQRDGVVVVVDDRGVVRGVLDEGAVRSQLASN